MINILQITDTHLFAPDSSLDSAGDEAKRLANVDTRQSLAAVLDMALAQRTPDLVLVTGDIAQDPHPHAYAELSEQIRSRFAGDILCLPGNHDEPEAAPALFESKSWSMNRWQVIALDSHVHGEERGELAISELERLASRTDRIYG